MSQTSQSARLSATAQALASVPYCQTSPAAVTRVVFDHLLLLAGRPAVVRMVAKGVVLYSSLAQVDEPKGWAERTGVGVGGDPPWDSGRGFGIELLTLPGGRSRNRLVRAVFERVAANDPEPFTTLMACMAEFPDVLGRAPEWLQPVPSYLAPRHGDWLPRAELERLVRPFARLLGTAPDATLRVAPTYPFRTTTEGGATLSYAVTDLPTFGAGWRVESTPSLNSAQVAVTSASGAVFPILVSGTPWFCFRLEATGPEGWRHMQRMYLHALPQLESRVRAAAKEAFFEGLVEPLRLALDERAPFNEQLLDRINQEWLKAAMVYPFPVLQLRLASGVEGSEAVLRLNGQPVRVEVLPDLARPLPPLFRYDPTPTEEIVERSKMLLQDYLRGRLASLDVIFSLGHELKNSLDQTKWASCFFHLSRHDPTKPLDPELLVETLQGFRQLIWPVGLAAALRAIAKTDQGTDLRSEWLAPDWVAAASQPFPAPEVTVTYRDTIRYLLDLLVSLEDRDGRTRLLEASGPQLAGMTLEEAWGRSRLPVPQVFDERRLRFPPLQPSGKEQVNAPYVLTGFAVEPIRNALSATLDAYRPPPLRSTIARPLITWHVRDGADEVIFEIGNPVGNARAGGPERLGHAAWLVSHLGRLLNVARLDGPSRVETRDGAPFVTFAVALFPHRLVRRPLDPNWTP